MTDIFGIFHRNKDAASHGGITHIVAGLGNPGDKYTYTHHNAGFLAMSYLAQKEGIKINRLKFKALTARADIAGVDTLLMLPQTYMNNSGEAIGEAARYYKIPPENIIVISDDVVLDAGKMRIRAKGSSGGQKGLQSIIEHLGSDAFPRIRLGVGTRPEGISMVDWVLKEFPKADREPFYATVENAYEAVKLILNGKTQLAMSKFN